MKSKFTVLLLLTVMTIGILPSSYSVHAEGVPPAKFVNITVDGEELTNHIVKVNTTVKIHYTAQRFEVDGVVLLGSGNNLTESVDDAVAANFSLNEDKASGPTKYFSIEFNITEYTKFYAYAWKGNYSNGVIEDFTSIDSDLEGQAYHHIWVEGEQTYPKFKDVINADRQDPTEDFLAPLGTNVSIRYYVTSPTNNTIDRITTISFSDNQTNVLNNSRSTFANMTWLSYNNDTQTHLFEYNMTVSSRVIFFTAFNNKGWERVGPQESRVHRLSTGFSFSGDYEHFADNEFSDIDNIYSNVTAINKTADDIFFVRYRITNDTSDITEANWTDVELVNITTPQILNASLSNNTITVYAFNLNTTLNYTKQIEIQAYVKNHNLTEYRPSKVFDVYDSRPEVKIFGEEFRYSNSKKAVIEFSASATKGELSSVLLVTKQNRSNFIDDTFEVKNKDGLNTKANQTVNLNVEGVYIVSLNATSNFNRSRIVEIAIHVDFTPPEVSITLAANASNAHPGLITLNFNYNELGLNDSGIDKAYLDWGNGLVEDVTGKNSASLVYTRSGTFDVVLTVWDLAGNNNSFTLSVTIDKLPNENTSTSSPTPLAILPVLAGIVALVYIKQKSKF